MELEQMTLEELFSVKGGIWVETENGWEWSEAKSLPPHKEEE